MKRMPFEPPTEHYDEQLINIDEQICDLLKQRKDLSNNHPGFPKEQFITNWSKKYNLYEGFLNRVFAHLLNEDLYKPVVEPKGFLKNIPILKSFDKNGLFYTVTFLRQFENASIVHLTIDREHTDEQHGVDPERHTWFDLSIENGKGTEFDCRSEGGGGTQGHTSFTFIVSPALPEDISEYKLIFKERKSLNKMMGFEFAI